MTREEFGRVVGQACEFGRSTVGVSGAKHQLLIHDAEQRKTIERLRLVLEFISINDHSLTATHMAQCAAQALTETEPRDERETNP